MDYFTSGSLIRLVFRWKFHLVIIVVIAAGASMLFSGEWFITPRYKSTAVLYPSNLIPYGSETPTEQMLQLLQSNDIRNNIISKYNLAKHYGIDTTRKGYVSSLIAEFKDNVIVRKTEFESVKIEVWDVNPDTAARIAKDMIHFLNLKARSLQREKSAEVVEIFENQMLAKKVELDSIEAQLKQLRVKYGLLDYEAQAKELTKKYLEAARSGNKANLNEVDAMMRNLEEKGGEFVALEDLAKRSRKVYNDLKVQYENALKDVSKELTYSNIVEAPAPADKKSYPVRWVIVLGYTSATFLLALIVLAFIDRRRSSRKTAASSGNPAEMFELEEQEVS
jgi:uncharacterized protein involved in exopolysaccharide biosynthesis